MEDMEKKGEVELVSEQPQKDVQENDAEEQQSSDDEEEVVQEYFCGIGRWRPKCLQVFRNPYFFTVLICSHIFIEGTLATGFIAVVLSSIQRRYNLDSITAGLIVSVFDMAVVVAVVFVSYFGGKGHKPRWLGVSLLIQGLGAIVFALPEFVFGSYQGCGNNVERMDVCSSVNPLLLLQQENITVPTCMTDNSDRYAIVFFFIGNILIGFGATPLFTIGPSYIDDIVRPRFVPIHLGVFYGMAVLGPALGFGLGAAFLSVYVDFWEDTTLRPTDPAYVGAWWLCFLFSGVLSLLLAIPYLMFPKLLPNSHLIKEERLKTMAQKYKKANTIEEEDSSLLNKIKSFPRHFFQVVTTLSWLFITLAVSFSAFAVNGVSAFSPKYYESQFNLTTSNASIAAGAVAIPTGFVGVLLGGLIVYFAKSKGRTAALINWVVTLIAIPPLLVFLLRCPTPNLAGITVPFAEDNFLIAKPFHPINASCSYGCNCNFLNNVYQPVCGSDGISYTSPCRAGCSLSPTSTQEDPVFENCTCIADNLISAVNITMEEALTRGVASSGSCEDGCINFPIFLVVSIVALLFVFTLAVPNIVITIRCVADEQRTLALGLQSIMFRIFGNVPGPIVFGVFFDLSCIFWNYEFPRGSTEAVRGACWAYNNQNTSYYILATVLISIALNFIFSFLSWLAYPKDDAANADEIEMKKDNTKDVRDI